MHFKKVFYPQKIFKVLYISWPQTGILLFTQIALCDYLTKTRIKIFWTVRFCFKKFRWATSLLVWQILTETGINFYERKFFLRLTDLRNTPNGSILNQAEPVLFNSIKTPKFTFSKIKCYLNQIQTFNCTLVQAE